MRILHLFDQSLPGNTISWRIEKSAISALNKGCEVLFGGPKNSVDAKKTFKKIYEINWTPRARRGFPYDWHCIKKQVGKVLKESKPDIVHANNIFSAKIMSEFDIPFIYDDHEYWPLYVKRQIEYYNYSKKNKITNDNVLKIFRNVVISFLNSNFLRQGLKWEKELVSSYPTITVSDKIAEELMELGDTNKVFVTPNYPLEDEIKDIPPPQFHKELSSVYAGIGNKLMPHRNIDGLTETFSEFDIGNLVVIGDTGDQKPIKRIKYTGFLPRSKMYEEMSKHSIGLVPFKNHWFHKYISPNKAYEYAHAGLFVMCTSSLITMSNILGEHCITFNNYEEMTSKLNNFKNNMEELYAQRTKIYEFARKNLVWNNYEKNILNAYKSC